MRPRWLRHAGYFKGSDDLSGLARLSPNHFKYISFVNPLVDQSQLRYLSHFTGLRRLHMSKTKTLTDVGLAHLRGLVNLEELDLYWCQITDDGLEHLDAMTKLRYLHLGLTQVRGPGLRHLGGLRRLEHLSLEDTEVDDEGLMFLGSLRNLRVLRLWSTKITDDGLDCLSSLSHLQELAIENTGVTPAGARFIRDALPSCCVGYRRPREVRFNEEDSNGVDEHGRLRQRFVN